MENASKALLMAGGVLIGVLILTLAVYLFTTFGATSSEIAKEIQSHEITEFNAKYTIYQNRDDLTVYDIITANNRAKEDTEDGYAVEVKPDIEFKDVSNYTEIDGNGNLTRTFKCNRIEFNGTER